MQQNTTSILEIIKNRRSIDPDDFNGKKVSQNIINEMLEATNWAPTHGFTEPWRFIVFDNENAQKFGEIHANLYKELTPKEQFLEKKYTKIKERSKLASHVIVCYNKRGDKQNIIELEELAATNCAIQNLLLVATTHNIGTFWSTGGMCYHPKFKEILNIDATNKMVGFIYVGQYDIENPTGKRNTNWTEKVTYWK